MAFFILTIYVFVFFVIPTYNTSGNSSFIFQPIILANDNFSRSEGEDDGDDDGEDVNQETKQEQVEAEVGPFWGIR